MFVDVAVDAARSCACLLLGGVADFLQSRLVNYVRWQTDDGIHTP